MRRLGRISWQEVPYRASTVLRSLAQSRGLFTADRVPAESNQAGWGKSWVTVAPGPDAQIQAAAVRLCAGELDVFGRKLSFGNAAPQWNADPVTGRQFDPDFGLFIDFRHLGEGVDIKFLWEVNRHLWWVPLAQHYALSGDRRCLEKLRQLLESWLDACPYARGPNWSSPVEHGIRLINWSLVWHLIGGERSALFDGDEGRRLRGRWLASIYQHMRFAHDNYSFYSSSDNHLVGEAAGIFVAAHTWDLWPDVPRLQARAKAILEREVLLQFSPDGVDLEQALCYQKFALQFFVASGLSARANADDFSAPFWARIESAVTFLAAALDSAGNVPAIGDSDDSNAWCLAPGAGFHAYRSMVAIGAALFQRSDLQAKVVACGAGPDPQLPWLGLASPGSTPADVRALPTRFEQGGYVILGQDLHSADEFRVMFDCGPLGYNRVAGHGHADALSVLVSWGGTPLLVDSGTYCYNAAPDYRHFFRGTHAHNTLVVDGQDQSDYGASFLWLRDINSTVIEDAGSTARSVHACHDGYERLADAVTHHRRVALDDAQLVVEDWLESSQPHDVELLWHAAAGATLSAVANNAWALESNGKRLGLAVDGSGFEAAVVEGRETPPQGWVSTGFYERTPAPVLSVRTRLAPRQVLRTTITRARAVAS